MDKNISHLFEKMVQGDRVALGQAMTLVESDREIDHHSAVLLLELCENLLLKNDPSLRLAISGAPGVGKSTLIEAIGLKAVERGYKVGVITIDPSSTFSHGSILGDKSRMTGLSTNPSAFIRSSPAGSVLGGMGRRSHEMITLLAAVGYDLILVETVGVGQSEHMAWQLTDGFVLVVQPGGGDELQGIKRGITELADMVIVNKADGQMAELAKLTKSHYSNALHYFQSLRSGWEPKIVSCSAIEGIGIDDVLDMFRLYMELIHETGLLPKERQKQKATWLNWTLGLTAHQLLMTHPLVSQQLSEARKDIETQNISIFKTAYTIEHLMKQLIQSTNLNTES
jgi:LAO/AO transport system kinase